MNHHKEWVGLKKSERQSLIKKIISEQQVTNQLELLAFLEEEGVETTQATISRDIRELNIIKTQNKDGQSVYKVWKEFDDKKKLVTDEEKLQNYLHDCLISHQRVSFMNIVKVLPGHGQSIAFLIDEIEFEDVVATVAGDDTILLISEDEEKSKKIYNYFAQLVESI